MVDPETLERLRTGDENVDEQHVQLYREADRLERVAAVSQDTSEIADFIYGFLHYAVTHFKDEEELMRRAGYPELEKQQRLHDDFYANMQRMAEGFEEGRPLTAGELHDFIVKWLDDHLQVEDLKLAEFLRDRRADATSDETTG